MDAYDDAYDDVFEGESAAGSVAYEDAYATDDFESEAGGSIAPSPRPRSVAALEPGTHRWLNSPPASTRPEQESPPTPDPTLPSLPRYRALVDRARRHAEVGTERLPRHRMPFRCRNEGSNS